MKKNLQNMPQFKERFSNALILEEKSIRQIFLGSPNHCEG